jgi:hypothetical protein
MTLVHEAFNEIYPGRELDKQAVIKYSGKFKPYNANVRYNSEMITFNLSKEWRKVSAEIKKGLFQSLLIKIYKGMPNTGYVDMYHSFVKNLSNYSAATKSEPALAESFDRVNSRYFNGLMDKPNLVWGSFSTSRLGSYEYQSNTIKISTIFQLGKNHLLDYIMYHELLHKKLKFHSKSGRSFHHTTLFRNAEKKFENQEQTENELRQFCRKARPKGFIFGNWFR